MREGECDAEKPSGVAHRRVRIAALLRGELLHVEAVEVDRLQQQRREAGVAYRVGQHAPGKGEQDARRLGIGEGMRLSFLQ